jgi:lon-related putative ATP-dependent protease
MMSPKTPRAAGQDPFRLAPEQLRWRCDPAHFSFTTTADITECPIHIIGQPRALEAMKLGLTVPSEGYNIFVSGAVGSGRSTVVRMMLERLERGEARPDDVVYVHNFTDPDQPQRLALPGGRGRAFRKAMAELVGSLVEHLPQMFDSEPYRKRRARLAEATAAEQKRRIKEFETRVQSEGFALVQVQFGPLTRPQLVPVLGGEATDLDQLEARVEEGKFARDEFESLRRRLTELKTQMEGLAKDLRDMDRELRRKLEAMDREVARPLIDEAITEVRSSFFAEGLDEYLNRVAEDLLEHLDELRAGPEGGEAPAEGASRGESILRATRYQVNVLVDNSGTQGKPIIWETAPSYRNVFGTIERSRGPSGEWETDHTRIKAGSLLRANGGILVLDALDALVEPGVWTALKRTLRTRRVEIQSFDPFSFLSGVSLKPEASPIDVKVVMIGTSHIHRLLRLYDEDFGKIFKIKAEFATETELSDQEIYNFACFVHKKVEDDDLPPFHRDAVAAVVEHGVRMAGQHGKLTTRFTEVADLIRESAYWARQRKGRNVRAEDVDEALGQAVYRVDLLAERLRERIADGTLLLDLQGEKVGQVNGLAVLDLGDHVFAQPSRITATTAMGRAGIINIDREAEMSGAIHTKGMLILSGFLRERFAQDKPLTLTASLCFEQNYGPIDGDSASSTELYALLSSLAEVPIRQGIAVTGSVNQRGEIQPIGGVNEKVEGFFDLCRLAGPAAGQGVMIPSRNLRHLMLRKDVVDAVRKGKFHVWAVSTIEEGLQVLTGADVGSRESGHYAPETLYGRVDARLTRLAEEVTRFGPADAGP